MTNQLDKIAPALVAAIAEMPALEMDATGQVGKRKYKYTTLGAVIAATRDILAHHKLAVTQQVVSDPTGDAVGVRTVLIHESGQTMTWEAVVKIPSGGNPGQDAGKLITYLRRYSLAAALNLYSDEDIDANDRNQQKAGQKVTKRKSPDQLIRELGFEPKPKKLTDLEMAKQVNNRDGKPYVDIPSDKLSHMSRSISNAINANGRDAKKLNELQIKQAAIQVILKSRAG